jgi:hypothetical protein
MFCGQEVGWGRVLANTAWMGTYGNTQVDFLETRISNHSSYVITVGKLRSFGTHPFKLFSFWAGQNF